MSLHAQQCAQSGLPAKRETDVLPPSVRYVLVYDLPWLLSAFQKLIFSWIPDKAKKQIFFKNRKNIQRVIPLTSLPDYMGGRCTQDYRQAPAQSLPFRQLFHQEFSDAEMERIHKYFDSVK